MATSGASNWDQRSFDEGMQKKYNILQQQADADTTKSNAAMQNVQQQPGMQAAQDAAAMARAQLNAGTQTNIAGMETQARRDVANLNEAGANYRTGLTTNTQRDIASQSLGFDREKLAQQNQQFGQTLGLDTAKAQESAIQGRAALGVNEYGTPSFNPKSGAMESAVKRPAITNLAPSPLSTIGSGNGLGMESDDTLRKIRAQLAQQAGQ